MNNIFDSSGKNPFQLPPLPQNYYFPSPSKEVPNKGIALTPQKLKHRNEYALPPEVYTPEQYSIVDGETASLRPPLPSCGYDEDIVRDLQHYLNDVDTWTSSQFCEQWPSKISDANEELRLQGCKNSFAMSTARSKTFKAGGPTIQDQRNRIKTSFASDKNISADSDRTSNIQMRLNRFRYGDPEPPEEREKRSTKILTSSAIGSVRTLSLSSRRESKASQLSSRKASTPRRDAAQKERSESILSKYSRISTSDFYCPVNSPKTVHTEPKPPIPPKIQDSPEAAERSISALSTRLEKLLQESTSAISSPVTVSPSLRTSTEKSSFEIRVSSSSSNDTTKSSELETSKMHSQEVTQNFDGELPRKMLWQKENLRPVDFPTSPQKIRKEDDILYQWRLKRKLETARDNVEKNTGPSFQPSTSPCTPWRRNEAEKPFVTRASEVHPQASCIYSPRMPVHQTQHTPRHSPLQHQPSCNCQTPSHTPCLYASTKEDAATSPTLPQYPTPMPELKNVAVGMAAMVSSETQTGQSLISMDDEATSDNRTTREPLKRSVSSSSFPHTSTPASSVSFHKVKIVEADVENSPQTSKGSPQVRNMSPMSGKTEATTLWSSADHNNKKIDDGRSPVSSVKTSDPRFASDSETFSPTADVVKEVVGSRLFDTSRTPSSTSAISRFKKRGKRTDAEKPTTVDDLNGSYTVTEHSSVKSEHSSVKSGHSSVKSSQKAEDERVCVTSGTSEKTPEEGQNFLRSVPSPRCGASLKPVENAAKCQEKSSASLSGRQSRNETEKSDFVPEVMLDKLLEVIANDPGDYVDDVVLQTLRSQRDQFLQEFRLIQEQIENLPPSEDDVDESHK